ncbi:hypothetical protein EYV94_15130 [Puteibacter caeruleilacunae]|nr:hypothetical protein EYV94_15130 [Puteibacter caeruleilacunae]
MRKIAFLFTLVFIALNTYAEEDWRWWNETHNWTSGMPSWKTMIKLSPGYLGPNALPVPENQRGLTPEKLELEFRASTHFSDGDDTEDLFLRFFYPFIPGKVGIELSGVLIEHFKMTPETRDERVARDYDGKGIAVGDIYFSTYIQLAKDARGWPDMMVRLTGRSASGNRYDAARYSDSPGYSFDLSFGKDIPCGKQANHWRWHGMLGFISWQTNSDMTRQNDALVFGAGLDLTLGKWTTGAEIAGYHGYKVERDSPVVGRFTVEKKLKNHSIRFRYQHGFHDLLYETFRFSYVFNFNLKKRYFAGFIH